MSFQTKVATWVTRCLGRDALYDKSERDYRFLEEALELVQANGMTREQAVDVAEYVYGRPPGDRYQEVGGVAVTLAALCTAHSIDLAHAAEGELERVQDKMEEIRAKQIGKPRAFI